MSYKAAVIGCGRVGCGFMLDPLRGRTSTHAGAYIEAGDIDLVALCDLDKETVGQYAEKLNAQAYTSYHEMLGCEKPDVVSVCTPPETHERIVCDVARRGARAIFCEKPISTNLCAAEHMIQVCNEQNVLLMINHQRRFSPFHQEIAHSIWRENLLGDIQQVTCYYGGGVANTGSHLFDLLRLYFGEVKAVVAHFSPSASHKTEDPNIDAEMEFERAPSVVIQACDCNNYAIFEINILGTEGRLRVLSSGYRAELETAQPSLGFAGIKELAITNYPFLHPEPNKWILFGVRHILDCLSNGVLPLSSGRNGLEALRIIEVLKVSAEAGYGRTISI